MTELKELDAIEASDPESSADVGALNLMRQIADRGGLALLVQRYAESPSLNLLHALAFLVAERSTVDVTVGEHVARLARRFARRPRHPEFALTLMTALQKEIRASSWHRWDPSTRASIADFVSQCLVYGGDEPHAILVWESALGLVSYMRNAGVLEVLGPNTAVELDGLARRLCTMERARIDGLLCREVLGE